MPDDKPRVLIPQQEAFVFSEKRFPCFIGGIGTGKTMCLLLKAVNFCERFPGALGLIVRKHYTDLHDSTLNDFRSYFGVDVDVHKEVLFSNGSKLMFRHGDETSVLKNINLDFVGIEQAEEFEDDTQFEFLRDRIRGKAAPYQQIFIIANANGHNWLWKNWVNNPPDGEYQLITATTFDNAANLGEKYIEDQRRREKTAPKHFRRMVMNCFDEDLSDDTVYTWAELGEAQKRQWSGRVGYGHRIVGFDVARYGNDLCAAVGIQQIGALAWQVFLLDKWGQMDIPTSAGRFQMIHNTYNVDDSIIDCDGIGGPAYDIIVGTRARDKDRPRMDWHQFRNNGYRKEDNNLYDNQRTHAAFILKDLLVQGHIAIPQEELIQELMTLKYKFMNDGRRILISKEEMRKQGVKSPNLADALLMAVSLIDQANSRNDKFYDYRRQWQQRRSHQRAPEGNLFKIAGIR